METPVSIKDDIHFLHQKQHIPKVLLPNTALHWQQAALPIDGLERGGLLPLHRTLEVVNYACIAAFSFAVKLDK